MNKKRTWKIPVIKSIDSCQPIFGECKIGDTPTPGGPIQCNAGNGASAAGNCTRGNGAASFCGRGNGFN